MVTEKTSDRLAADLASAAFQNGVHQELWELVARSGDALDVRIAAPDSAWYLLLLDCTNYWEQAILGQFIDPQTRQCVASAWPQGDGTFQQWIKFSPGNLFICWDQDRTGISKHSEWTFKKAWQRRTNQVVSYLEFVHTLLWLPKYGYSRRSA
jgi:hypothetical protein